MNASDGPFLRDVALFQLVVQLLELRRELGVCVRHGGISKIGEQ